jgi:hypothetical protein
MSEPRKHPAPPPPRRQSTDDAAQRDEHEIRESSEGRDDGQKRARIQRQLDDALAASFPASDPVSIVTSHRQEDGEED